MQEVSAGDFSYRLVMRHLPTGDTVKVKGAGEPLSKLSVARRNNAYGLAVAGSLILPMMLSYGCTPDIQADQEAQASSIVEELGFLPAGLLGTCCGITADISEPPRLPVMEVRREQLYRSLHDMGPDGVAALGRGLRHPDVGVRQNAALALSVLSRGGFGLTRDPLPALDIRAALSQLVATLGDDDELVRARSSHAVGNIGSDAVSAVPELINLLSYEDEASRIGACIALRGIGPPASSALPLLRELLSDASADVRHFAQLAIESIEQ